ncbi:hypothetical protein SUNI508_09736 [Seiridium unicorne]|uniref:Uncharacterized protein n=1 Tax=Seiridium unicorne TaxID=138068 RepID=A0ABR2UPD8_9PEZI
MELLAVGWEGNDKDATTDQSMERAPHWARAAGSRSISAGLPLLVRNPPSLVDATTIIPNVPTASPQDTDLTLADRAGDANGAETSSVVSPREEGAAYETDKLCSADPSDCCTCCIQPPSGIGLPLTGLSETHAIGCFWIQECNTFHMPSLPLLDAALGGCFVVANNQTKPTFRWTLDMYLPGIKCRSART